jgi:hypothetical protein
MLASLDSEDKAKMLFNVGMGACLTRRIDLAVAHSTVQQRHPIVKISMFFDFF